MNKAKAFDDVKIMISNDGIDYMIKGKLVNKNVIKIPKNRQFTVRFIII